MREAGMSARGSVSQNCKQLPCTPPFALHNAVCASRALCNVADGSGVVKVSKFTPELETDTDRFVLNGIRFKDQNFLWFTQHGDK